MNKFQKQIVKEEFARAAMIKTAKESLNESAFRGFLSEMRIYENKSILTEGVEPQDRYNSLLERLLEQTTTTQPPRTKIANTQGTGTGNVTAELEQEPDDPKKDPKKPNKFPNNISPESKQKLSSMGLTDPIKMANFIKKNPSDFKSGEDVEADAFIRSETARVSGKDPGSSYEAPEEPSGDVKKDTQNLGKELKSPKAKGILSSIFDSYKFAFASNAKMWEKIYDFINGVGNKPPAEQEKAAAQAEKELETAMPNPPESAEDSDGDEADKAPKALKVGSIQRPIVSVIQKVAAAQDIDMSIKQAQSIAIAITKNLSQQMRANGVTFKGDKPPKAKDIKESFMVELNAILKEERLTRDSMQKRMKTLSKTGTKNSGVKIGSQWIATAKELFQKIKANGLSKVDTFQDSMEDMKREPNNYIDFLDIAKDLDQLLQSETVKIAYSGARRKREEFKELKDSLMTVLNLYKQFKVVKVSKDEKGKILKVGFTPEYRKEYVKTKKGIKGLGKKDKAPQKDMSMATAEKGKVNISKTVAKAIQAGGLDQDVAKKIAPILKKKIEKIIAKHMDGDVRYLEEKVNRYVKKVLQEIK